MISSLIANIDLHAVKVDSRESVESVDRLNAEFYSRFPYPPLAAKFESLEDPDFERVMLCQNIGDFTHSRLPRDLSIWVAGCGTNQALQTALRFPQGSVLGTELSTGSLELASQVSATLKLDNLDLLHQSLANAVDQDRFDYVICTGVVHHNADPSSALKALARALKPGGILELMVYNVYHRAFPMAFQKAVQLLGQHTGRVDCSDDMEMAKILMKSVPDNTRMGQWLDSLGERSESDIADLLIQPVENTYTVESLASLAAGAGLELLIPTLSPLMKYRNLPSSWDLNVHDPVLRETYERLPDTVRWHIGNLLLNEDSPMLWFYLQRQDSPYPRRSEQEACDAFLESTWMPARTAQKSFIRDGYADFKLSPKTLPYPFSRPEAGMKTVLDAVDPGDSMRAVLETLGWEPTRARVNEVRTKLATSANPYLRSIS